MSDPRSSSAEQRQDPSLPVVDPESQDTDEPSDGTTPHANAYRAEADPSRAWTATIRSDCPRCRYDLTGLTIGSYCPECGLIIGTVSDSALPASGFASASLVFGILSFPACIAFGVGTFVFGVLALGFCWGARRQVKRGERARHSLGLANAGAICGITAMAMIGGLWIAAMIL